MSETNQQQLYALVYEVVREIPEGKVATYGQIAKLIGLPRHARHVGFALANLSTDNNVPWHRVINSKGELHKRVTITPSIQQEKLEKEGIILNKNTKVSLKKYQWLPDV